MLEGISQQAMQLKEIALEQQSEIEKQGKVLDNLEDHVDKVNEKLLTQNQKLKQLVTQVRAGDKFCVDIILLVILLGIIGVVYTMLK